MNIYEHKVEGGKIITLSGSRFTVQLMGMGDVHPRHWQHIFTACETLERVCERCKAKEADDGRA